MPGGYWWVWPGQKINMNPPLYGVSSAIRFTAKSDYEAKKFFRCHGFPEDFYKSVVSKLKYPKFRTQFSEMSSYEIFKDKKSIGRIYDGRNFSIRTWFVSCKKDGSNYKIIFAPYTASLITRTFLWHKGPYSDLDDERLFNYYRRNDKKYISDIATYVHRGRKILNCPYPVLINSTNIEIIYQKLSKYVSEERDKFVKLTY